MAIKNRKKIASKNLLKEKRKKLIRETQLKIIKEYEEWHIQDCYDILSTASSFCDLTLIQDNEIVTINISGEVFQTYDATLARYPNTLLGDRRERMRLINPESGEIYLDRNVKAFECIFYYYQSGGEMDLPLVIPFTNSLRNCFIFA